MVTEAGSSNIFGEWDDGKEKKKKIQRTVSETGSADGGLLSFSVGVYVDLLVFYTGSQIYEAEFL